MNTTGKFSHTFFGWVVSMGLSGWMWIQLHAPIVVSIIVGVFAIRASLWTAKAAKETIRTKREERKPE